MIDRYSILIAIPIMIMWICIGSIAYQEHIYTGGSDESAIGIFIFAFPIGIIYLGVLMMAAYIPCGIFIKIMNGEDLDILDYIYLLSN